MVKFRNGYVPAVVPLDEKDLWIRGRVLVIYGFEILRSTKALRGESIADIARELGVSRQALYRACPEFVGTKLDVVG